MPPNTCIVKDKMPINRLLLGYFATLGDFKTKIPMAVDREEEEREGEVEPDGTHARRRWAASAWGQPATGGPWWWWWWGGDGGDDEGGRRRLRWGRKTTVLIREDGGGDEGRGQH